MRKKQCTEFEEHLVYVLQALHMNCEFERARDMLAKAQRIKPGSRDINNELEQLEKYEVLFTLKL